MKMIYFTFIQQPIPVALDRVFTNARMKIDKSSTACHLFRCCQLRSCVAKNSAKSLSFFFDKFRHKFSRNFNFSLFYEEKEAFLPSKNAIKAAFEQLRSIRSLCTTFSIRIFQL